MKTETWQGCYDSNWNGQIVPEAFAHPAKFANGLIHRIIEYGLAQGYWSEGDTIGDPFGGVALGGIIAGYYGLNWFGVELEERFVSLGNQNLDLHRAKWAALGYKVDVRLVQGDSRAFAEIVSRPDRVDAAITSPPYAEGLANAAEYRNPERARADANRDIMRAKAGKAADAQYGSAPGQIGRLPAGQVDSVVTSPPFGEDQPCASQTRTIKDYHAFTRGDGTKRDHTMRAEGNIANLPQGELSACITSPPYAESIGNENGIDYSKAKGPKDGLKPSTARDTIGGPYSADPQNIGNLKQGSLDGAITSPPYADGGQGYGTDNHPERSEGMANKKAAASGNAFRGGYGQTEGQIGNLSGGSVDACVTSPPFKDKGACQDPKYRTDRVTSGGPLYHDYGQSQGQIGNSTGETYWEACKTVYEQMQLTLKPGGVACVVLKSYVKAGKIVDLPGDTLKLLVALGFEPLERVRAMLVKESTENTLFEGEVKRTKSKKSFFRRLCEAKGSPKIDFEEVLFVRTSLFPVEGPP